MEMRSHQLSIQAVYMLDKKYITFKDILQIKIVKPFLEADYFFKPL